jgi:hypothetical protein
MYDIRNVYKKNIPIILHIKLFFNKRITIKLQTQHNCHSIGTHTDTSTLIILQSFLNLETRGVDKFFKTLARLASSSEFLLAKLENNWQKFLNKSQ